MSASAPSLFSPAGKATADKLGLKLGRANLDIFAETLLELARADRNIVAVTSDSRGSGKLGPFGQVFPEQLVEVGIAGGPPPAARSLREQAKAAAAPKTNPRRPTRAPTSIFVRWLRYAVRGHPYQIDERRVRRQPVTQSSTKRVELDRRKRGKVSGRLVDFEIEVPLDIDLTGPKPLERTSFERPAGDLHGSSLRSRCRGGHLKRPTRLGGPRSPSDVDRRRRRRPLSTYAVDSHAFPRGYE